jgi:hypothetical protein
VCVFGALTNLTREEILFDIPDAVNGKTLVQWEAYVNSKGWERKLVRHQPGEEYPLPCAQLHQIFLGFYHWIFRLRTAASTSPARHVNTARQKP